MPHPSNRLRAITVATLTLAARALAAQHAGPHATPIAPLGLLHELANPPPESVLATDGDVLVTHGSSPRHLVTWDTATDRERLDLSGQPGTPRWLMLPTLFDVHGGLLVGSNRGTVIGVDARTGQQRFATTLGAASEVVTWSYDAMTSAGDLWVAATARFVAPSGEDDDRPVQMTHELIAVRVADGHVAWRRPSSSGAMLATDGQRLFVADYAGPVRALDLATGAERWHAGPSGATDPRPCTGVVALSVSHNVLAITCPLSRVLLLDASTGASVDAVTGPPGSLLRPVAQWSNGIVLSEYTAAATNGSEGRLRAFGVRPLRALWTSSPRAAHGFEIVHTAVLDDVLYHCDDSAVVEGVSLVTGQTVWTWGFARCVDVETAGSGAAGRLYVSHGDGVAVFAPGASSTPIETARFEGTVTLDGAAWPGARVRVGTASVTTDAQGRYHVEVSARGALTVAVVSGLPPSVRARGEHVMGSEAPAVRLDGRRAAYTVNLATRAGHIDFDR